ncbi:MAG: class II fumarate hydratase [Evtepia sp.]|uniref:class II fumarate hydratase n=1 Tax=Evtepia sp. TaxID=2773933 RepID=UPI002A75635C|nr:class II fumarate hydratase [Evtepia sp.]MDY3015100.1 class II fumarate hydratase [Evtepia sp.]
MEYRMEHDTMGQVAVPADRYWGAQTQRSYENFPIGQEKMPDDLIRAFAILKQSCAAANHTLGKLDDRRFSLIQTACQAILAGKLDGHFPLSVWQTGSGTQTNMNLNEVIANYGNGLAGEPLLHPNDHVNMSQSSNDTFPTALHLSAATAVHTRLLPALEEILSCLRRLEEENKDIVKTGRTHLQDAGPITVGQEISGWTSMILHAKEMILASLDGLYELALGGTAVGTGLNAPKGFDQEAAQEAARLTGLPFRPAANKFHSLTAKDALVFSHGALKALAANLMKIANDVRWLASGPRCGLGEIFIPENEPGSSIMPGKVNPTQCEALTMVAVQVMGNDTIMGIAASQGNFELNVYMPVMAYNYLQSVRLLADAMTSFTQRCLTGLTPNREKMAENLHRSLMTVTALTPLVGYENGAKIAKKAHKENISLKEAAVSLGLFTPEAFDEAFHPETMI